MGERHWGFGYEIFLHTFNINVMSRVSRDFRFFHMRSRTGLNGAKENNFIDFQHRQASEYEDVLVCSFDPKILLFLRLSYKHNVVFWCVNAESIMSFTISCERFFRVNFFLGFIGEKQINLINKQFDLVIINNRYRLTSTEFWGKLKSKKQKKKTVGLKVNLGCGFGRCNGAPWWFLVYVTKLVYQNLVYLVFFAIL